ncbi:hypothetical protein [Accumulibacter sp.]|uniref:hypothetical protein n=1 Tax=Accumulibacter sp. TaxID=2053492 RepID=UPI0028C39257|nr:hypothetical protein [Accumulibacter sp.]
MHDLLANALSAIFRGRNDYKKGQRDLGTETALALLTLAFEPAVETRSQLLQRVGDKPFRHDQVARKLAN